LIFIIGQEYSFLLCLSIRTGRDSRVGHIASRRFSKFYGAFDLFALQKKAARMRVPKFLLGVEIIQEMTNS